MKKQNSLVRTLALVGCLGLLTAISLNSRATRVQAFNPQPDPPAFGLITLNPGQTLRLNVVNTCPADPTRPEGCRGTRHVVLGFDAYRQSERSVGGSDAEARPGPCVNARKVADRQSCEVALNSGEAASFDYNVPSDGLTQILPVVQDDQSLNQVGLLYTLEVREGGRTIYFVPSVQRGLPSVQR